jgi:citrate synthase
MTEFRTRVSEVADGIVNLRGYSLRDVMCHLSYAEGAFLTIIGRLPTDPESRLVNAVLNSLLDHGFVASTITAARYIASGNPNFVPAVAGGLLAAGSNTLSPQHSFEVLERAASVRNASGGSAAVAAATVVAELRALGRRIPGLGHPTHKDSDFRADVLFALAEEVGLAGPAQSQLRAIHAEFVATTGKRLPINVDGALACIGMDLGWSADQTVAFALLSVLPGLMAHVIEEIDSGVALRHITAGSYEGDAVVPLPVRYENGGHDDDT